MDEHEHKRTLKVTNLSKDAEREDLYDLFNRFGPIGASQRLSPTVVLTELEGRVRFPGGWLSF